MKIRGCVVNTPSSLFFFAFNLKNDPKITMSYIVLRQFATGIIINTYFIF